MVSSSTKNSGTEGLYFHCLVAKDKHVTIHQIHMEIDPLHGQKMQYPYTCKYIFKTLYIDQGMLAHRAHLSLSLYIYINKDLQHAGL